MFSSGFNNINDYKAYLDQITSIRIYKADGTAIYFKLEYIEDGRFGIDLENQYVDKECLTTFDSKCFANNKL